MPTRVPFALALALAAALVVAACGAGSPAPSGPSTTAENGVFELEMTGSIQIVKDGRKVDSIAVKRGQTYTFRITNTAGFAHDFHIGGDADLAANRSGLPGLGEYSTGTQEFSYTFDSDGPLMFGCTVPGHYGLMKGRFEIQP